MINIMVNLEGSKIQGTEKITTVGYRVRDVTSNKKIS